MCHYFVCESVFSTCTINNKVLTSHFRWHCVTWCDVTWRAWCSILCGCRLIADPRLQHCCGAGVWSVSMDWLRQAKTMLYFHFVSWCYCTNVACSGCNCIEILIYHKLEVWHAGKARVLCYISTDLWLSCWCTAFSVLLQHGRISPMFCCRHMMYDMQAYCTCVANVLLLRAS